MYPNVNLYDMYNRDFLTFPKSIEARGLLNLGKKHSDHQNWENLMQSKRTGLQF